MLETVLYVFSQLLVKVETSDPPPTPQEPLLVFTVLYVFSQLPDNEFNSLLTELKDTLFPLEIESVLDASLYDSVCESVSVVKKDPLVFLKVV